ncbi:transcriptional regulator [Campylobacter jejuni]|nr:transcriptional regulator [Campylobacter jejuni]
MAREKSDIKFRNVSMRIPDELYSDYKKVLAKTGSIVTYDIRNYMKKVVECDKKEMQKGQK